MAVSETTTWFDRNWKWFVPLACVWGLIVLACFVGLVFYFLFGMLKSNDAYKEALTRARADRSVVMALGQPIREGFFVSGSICLSGSSENAELKIPISGPKGTGIIVVVARMTGGRWQFRTLQVEVAGSGAIIYLLKPGEAPDSPAGNSGKDSVGVF